MSTAHELRNDRVVLEPASEANVDILVRWTLDPVAQGPFKRVPELSATQLRDLFLREPSRQYFMVRLVPDGTPIGRLYWRAWRAQSKSPGFGSAGAGAAGLLARAMPSSPVAPPMRNRSPIRCWPLPSRGSR